MIITVQRPTSPLSLHRHLSERSSPSRVRSAAQNQRALDCSGPFRTLTLEKGKGATAKAKPFSVCSRVLPPAGRPRPKIPSPALDDVNNLQA
jgi:hypothetical protein